jgi:dienelactone hydrolase
VTRSRIESLRKILAVPTVSDARLEDVILRNRDEGFDLSSATIRDGEGVAIPALLMRPHGSGPFPGVVVHHQHASEWHLGKSEVAGLAGDNFQAFGPALASRGVVVLAYDAIGFEDRRPHASGISPHESDWLAHYNSMAHRLVHNKLLLRDVLHDASRALAGLRSLPEVEPSQTGVVGHSMGCTISLYQAALDPSVAFAACSCNVVSFRHRIEHGTGIGMIELVPGIADTIETVDLVRALAPRPLLIVSASRDKYSGDSAQIVAEARPAWATRPDALVHIAGDGEHALDEARFGGIVDWVSRLFSFSPHQA